MTTLSLGFVSQCDTSARVDNSGLLDDQTISVQTSNVASRVGKSNFLDFVGVKPDLALSALQDVGRKALLEFQGDYRDREKGDLMRDSFQHYHKETFPGIKRQRLRNPPKQTPIKYCCRLIIPNYVRPNNYSFHKAQEHRLTRHGGCTQRYKYTEFVCFGQGTQSRGKQVSVQVRNPVDPT